MYYICKTVPEFFPSFYTTASNNNVELPYSIMSPKRWTKVPKKYSIFIHFGNHFHQSYACSCLISIVVSREKDGRKKYSAKVSEERGGLSWWA